MTTLHVINRSLNRSQIEPFCMTGDAVILIENGVYSLTQFSTSDSAIPAFAVEADVLARGVQPGAAIGLVDYVGFVQLCTDFDKVVTW